MSVSIEVKRGGGLGVGVTAPLTLSVNQQETLEDQFWAEVGVNKDHHHQGGHHGGQHHQQQRDARLEDDEHKGNVTDEGEWTLIFR